MLPFAALSGLFALAQVLYAVAGVRFDASPLGGYWQFIDPQLLRHHPWQSLCYEHADPPLFNLVLAAGLRWAPHHFAGVMQGFHIAVGYAFALAVFGIARRVGVSSRWAVGIALLATVNPAAALYENWLYVEWDVAALLAVMTYCLIRYGQSRQTWWAFAGFLAAAVIVFVRSLYPWFWLLAIVLLVIWLLPGSTRRTLTAATLPLLLCLGLSVKKADLFRQPTTAAQRAAEGRAVAGQPREVDRRPQPRRRGLCRRLPRPRTRCDRDGAHPSLEPGHRGPASRPRLPQAFRRLPGLSGDQHGRDQGRTPSLRLGRRGAVGETQRGRLVDATLPPAAVRLVATAASAVGHCLVPARRLSVGSG